MTILNVEIKARCEDPDKIRKLLREHHADFKVTDHQIDTYFSVPDGRLKLREGNIENNLIYYRRTDTKDPKPSQIDLMPVDREYAPVLKNLLSNALDIKIVVDKKREIYFIENIKFHLDEVAGLGSFVEIEAIDNDGTITEADLRDQCRHFMKLFGISNEDLVAQSYSDLVIGY